MGYPNEDCGCGCNSKSCENFNVEIVKQTQTQYEFDNNIFTFKVIIINGTGPYDITWLKNSNAYVTVGSSKLNVIKVQLNSDLSGLDPNDFFLKVIVVDTNSCIAKDTWVMKNYTEVESCPCFKLKAKIVKTAYDPALKAFIYRVDLLDENVGEFTYEWEFASDTTQYEFVGSIIGATATVSVKSTNIDDSTFYPFMLKVTVKDSDTCFATDYFYQEVYIWNYFYNRS